MPHVPYVARKTALIHRLADRAISRIAQCGHDIAIELADPSQLVAWNRKAGERCTALGRIRRRMRMRRCVRRLIRRLVRRLMRRCVRLSHELQCSQLSRYVGDAKRWPRCRQDAASYHPRHSSAENTANAPSPFSTWFLTAAGDACEHHQKLQRHPYVDLSEVPHHHLVVHELHNEAPQNAKSQQPSSKHAEEAVFEGPPVVEEDEGHSRHTPRSSPYAVSQSQHSLWN